MMKMNDARYSALTKWSMAFMALHAAAEGCSTPFLTIYFRQLGLTSPKIGFLLGMKILVGASFGPCWRHFARKIDRLKLLLMCSVFAAILFRIALSFIPPISSELLLDYCADSNQSFHQENLNTSFPPVLISPDEKVSAIHDELKGTAKALGTPVLIRRVNHRNLSNVTIPPLHTGDSSARDQSNSLLFVITFVTVVVGEMFASSGIQVVRSSLYHHLDDTDNLSFFPPVLTICSLSHGISAFLVSGAIDQLPCIVFENRSSMVVQFACSVFFLVLCIVLWFFLPVFQSHSFLHSASRVVKAGQFLLSDLHYIFLMCGCFALGLLVSLSSSFLFWHLQDLGGTELSMGCYLFFESVSHSVVRFRSHWFMQKCGVFGVLGVSVVCLSLMYLYLGLIWNAWMALFVTPISGFVTTLFWQTLSDFLERTSPPGLFHALLRHSESFSALGTITGCISVGLMGSIIRFKVIFVIFGILAASWGVLSLVVMYFLPKKETVHYAQLFRSEGASDDEENEEDWLEKALEEEQEEVMEF